MIWTDFFRCRYTKTQCPLLHICIFIFSLRFLRATSLWLCICTLAATLITTLVFGELPKGHLPYISDLWVYPPGNWISRWGVIQGCSCAIASQVLLYYVKVGPTISREILLSRRDVIERDESYAAVPGDGTNFSRMLTVIAIFSFLSLSVVGSVDEKENDTIHRVAAVCFFGGFQVYMFLSAISKQLPPGSEFAGWLYFLTSALMKIRFPLYHATTVKVPENILVILEWSDTLCIVAFMYLDVFRREATKKYAIMVLGGFNDCDATSTSGHFYSAVNGNPES